MKLLKLHITILTLLALPGLLVPLSLWGPVGLLPDILGILAILYVLLWIFHSLITSILVGGLLLLRISQTQQVILSIHVIIFIVMLVYAIFLFST